MKTIKNICCLFIIALFVSSCAEESSSTELENRPVYLQLVNTSGYTINSLRVNFKTYTDEFTLNYPEGLSPWEKSEFILLPSLAHDAKESVVYAEIDGSNIELGKLKAQPEGELIQFVQGEYYLLIRLDQLSFQSSMQPEELDYIPGHEYEGGNKLIRIQNTGNIDLESVSLRFLKEECIDNWLEVMIGASGPETCQEDLYEEPLEFGELVVGQTTVYKNLSVAHPSPVIEAKTVLGHSFSINGAHIFDVSYVPTLENGAYTFNLNASDNSIITREYEDDNQHIN